MKKKLAVPQAPAAVATVAVIRDLSYENNSVIMRIWHEGTYLEVTLLDGLSEPCDGEALLVDCENAIGEWISENPEEDLEEEEGQ